MARFVLILLVIFAIALYLAWLNRRGGPPDDRDDDDDEPDGPPSWGSKRPLRDRPRERVDDEL